jgi:hypothetical protein
VLFRSSFVLVAFFEFYRRYFTENYPQSVGSAWLELGTSSVRAASAQHGFGSAWLQLGMASARHGFGSALLQTHSILATSAQHGISSGNPLTQRTKMIPPASIQLMSAEIRR